MKYINCILSIWFIFLGSYPGGDMQCFDLADSCEVVATHQCDHPATAGDDCSPFCIDGCCINFYYYPSLQVELASTEFRDFNAVILVEKFHPHFTTSIWQPPKNA